jgi:nicotinate dehydrogenase subunit A
VTDKSSAKREIELTVNGERHRIAVGEDVPLAFVLRNDLGLKSVKLGCGLEQCGSCRVIVDGVPTASCVTGVGAFRNTRIETVEGFATGSALHPVQRALADTNAAQCGYCLSGIMVAAKALFDRTATPSRHEIRSALDPHLCRCGAQPRVLRALDRLAGHD